MPIHKHAYTHMHNEQTYAQSPTLINTQTHTRTSAHTCTYVCTITHTHTNTHAQELTHAHTYTHVHTGTHARALAHTLTHTHTLTNTCKLVQVHNTRTHTTHRGIVRGREGLNCKEEAFTPWEPHLMHILAVRCVLTHTRKS